MYKMLRDRMVVLFLLLPFYFNSFQNQTDKKPEANSSARKLIIIINKIIHSTQTLWAEEMASGLLSIWLWNESKYKTI